ARGQREYSREREPMALAAREALDRPVRRVALEAECCGIRNDTAHEVGPDTLFPPTALSWQQCDASSPCGRRDRRLFVVVEEHPALVRVEVREHPQQHRFAGTGWAADREAFAGSEFEV